MEVSPVSPTSSIADIRKMVAHWKGVESYQIELAVGIRKATDYLTLLSAGLSSEQGVSVVVTPALDFGRPVPRGIYMEIFGLLDTEDAEHGLHTGMYLY